MTFKRIAGSMLVLLGTGLAATLAQPNQTSMSQASNTVAVVDMTLIFQKAQMVQDLEKIFGQEKTRIQAEADQRKEKIKDLQKELESGAFAKGSEDYQEREDQMIKLNVESESWLQLQQKHLKDAHQQWFENLYKRVAQACQEIAQANGVDVVLSDNPVNFDVANSDALIQQILQKKVIFASPRVDMTAPVLEQVNSNYQKDGGAGVIKLAK